MTPPPRLEPLIAALRAVNARRWQSGTDDPLKVEAATQVDVEAGVRGEIETARHRLAIYGTLAPGEANHHVVEGLGGTWIRGRVRGTLEPRGWGATLGFPALTWDPGADPVEVQLLESRALAAAWPELDAFEGDGYLRILVPVELAEVESAGPGPVGDADEFAAIRVANLYASRSEPQH